MNFSQSEKSMTRYHKIIKSTYHNSPLLLGSCASKQEASQREIFDKVFTQPRLIPTCLLASLNNLDIRGRC